MYKVVDNKGNQFLQSENLKECASWANNKESNEWLYIENEKENRYSNSNHII